MGGVLGSVSIKSAAKIDTYTYVQELIERPEQPAKRKSF